MVTMDGYVSRLKLKNLYDLRLDHHLWFSSCDLQECSLIVVAFAAMIPFAVLWRLLQYNEEEKKLQEKKRGEEKLKEKKR